MNEILLNTILFIILLLIVFYMAKNKQKLSIPIISLSLLSILVLNLINIYTSKEKYDHLQVDYIPSYMYQLPKDTSIKSQEFQSMLPTYNSQIFCKQFPNYIGCDKFNNGSQNINPSIFIMALLSSFYGKSLANMLYTDYPKLNINNAIGISNINKTDITPFIPYISYIIDTSSVTNFLEFAIITSYVNSNSSDFK